MAKTEKTDSGKSLPLIGMVMLGALGGLVVALSLKVINYWPQPVSIAPYFGAKSGVIWGVIVGAINGLVLGFLTDDKHFPPHSYK